ncbi:MAG: phosphoenolpyruvate carboxykinase [Actinomycetota bacterium]|nr:phosphoenolpyruvate carboxykinase [Actinomycetota bacterium]
MKVIIRAHDLCRTPVEILMSAPFKTILEKFLRELLERESPRLGFLKEVGFIEGAGENATIHLDKMINLFVNLLEPPRGDSSSLPGGVLPSFATDLYYLVESLYDYWRMADRFLIFEEDYKPTQVMTREYHDSFRRQVSVLEELVRGTYRRLAENLTGSLFKVYRQLPSGAEVGLLCERIPCSMPGAYQKLEGVPFIQLVIIRPPLIYYTRSNKREGTFTPVDENPIEKVSFGEGKWFCMPIKVGLLKTFVYFHADFMPLGVSLANLFEIASGEEVREGNPDCVVVFSPGERETVFYEDPDTETVVGLVSGGGEVDYFGYMKKMILTLHNLKMIADGWFPIHGAMARIILRGGAEANVVIVGDSGTGKSESLEAFRSLAGEYISDMEVVFDDMGTLGLDEAGNVIAYGTEIGAFVRLDDLEAGYAYSELDRSIFINPHLTNARVVIPITPYDAVVKGHRVDYFLYANNYEDISSSRPPLEFSTDVDEALEVFESGARISKGTTDEQGLVQTYFANPFGAVQKEAEHRRISREFFLRMLSSGVRLGQVRTRLGIGGYELEGPKEAARALFEEIRRHK